ncbi:hypothetical protein B0T22DRAFT_249168 [Podospora appendiculata]|uniref:Uncharacterized protein n=1 Tax=Podospora appendiculata TaxID=314037 RepID=A0AAE1C8Y1_9PEZI|nr:hypothetical protein B0T22DRAFT_249168 [Podospora appendiculata]
MLCWFVCLYRQTVDWKYAQEIGIRGREREREEEEEERGFITIHQRRITFLGLKERGARVFFIAVDILVMSLVNIIPSVVRTACREASYLFSFLSSCLFIWKEMGWGFIRFFFSLSSHIP